MPIQELYCRLTEFKSTEEGDFIPKGTPVQVLGWSDKKEGFLICRTSVYIYTDSLPNDFRKWNGNVNDGLYIDVPMHQLDYYKHYSHGE